MPMFIATISGEEFTRGPSFCAVFKEFLTEIIKIVGTGAATDQWLETSNWIELSNHSGRRSMMDFNQVRDFAYEIGLLVDDGKLQENAPEPDAHVIERAFSEGFAEGKEAFLKRASKALSMDRAEA